MSLRKKKKNKHCAPPSEGVHPPPDNASTQLSASLGQVRLRNDSPSSRHSTGSDRSSNTPSLGRKSRHKKKDDIEMGIKNVEVINENVTLHTVEVLKRPGQTLGFYIREGNGKNTKKGVFISRIAENSIVEQNGLLKVGDEIQAINSVNVTRTNLDDVVVLMSIPKKLILTIKSHRPTYKHSSSEPSNYKPIYIQKQHSDETESVRQAHEAVDLNTEDSNDSGLSSEHSVKGDRLFDPHATTRGLPTSVPSHVYQIPAEPVYANKPRSARPELYSSDCEHEYNPVPRLSSSRNGKERSKDAPHSHRHQYSANHDAYNSDSELLPRSQYANVSSGHHQQSYWNSANNSALAPGNESNYVASKPPGFSSEMQHWLKKFDHMSEVSAPTSSSTSHNAGRYRVPGIRLFLVGCFFYMCPQIAIG